MTVLEWARSARYEVGTNLKGRGLDAAWTLLLPTLDIETVGVVGKVRDSQVEAIDVLAKSRTDLADAHALDALGVGGLDLLVVDGTALNRRTHLSDLAKLARHLDEYGAMYAESNTEGVEVPGDMAVRRFDVWPNSGAARVFVPSGDASTTLWLRGLGFLPHREGIRLTPRFLNSMARLPLARNRLRRMAYVATGRSVPSHGPPAFVSEVAADAGIDITSAPWALVAPGDYPSQKALMLVFDASGGAPSAVVKLSPDPRHADRLRNEAEALEHLAGLGVPEGTVPSLLFAGRHAGRGVVGESWIGGNPFTAAATVNGPELGLAASWLQSLSVRTVEQRSAADVGEAVRDLFARFRAVHALAPDEIAFLDEQVHAIESHEGRIPVVLQHGDPGIWNLQLRTDGAVAFLDWESAERHGMPLWDLIHLQWSFGTWASRRAGERRRLAASMRHIASHTELHARFADQLAAAADAVALPPSLIGPLFYTAWMYRSLKEATRRTPDTLQRGLYVRVLRELVRRRQSSPIRSLLHSPSR